MHDQQRVVRPRRLARPARRGTGLRPSHDGYLPGARPLPEKIPGPRKDEPDEPRDDARNEPPRGPRTRRRAATGWVPPERTEPRWAPRQPRPRRRPDRSHTTRVLVALVISLAGVAGVLVGASAWTLEQLSAGVDRVDDAFPSGDRPAAVGGGLNSLVVGLDTSPGTPPGGEPAFVAVWHVTGDRRHVQLVSLPANLSTEADGAGALRDVFTAGGPADLVAAVESLSGVRIDHYAELDLEAFGSLTDELGGIVVDIPASHRSRGELFDPGRQRLDGAQALAYMRSPRSDPDEIEAVPRQQQVVRALFERVHERGFLADLDRSVDLVGLMTANLRVDDSLDAPALARLAWDLRTVRQPAMLTVPALPVETQTGDPVHRMDEERATELWGHLENDTLAEHLGDFS